MISKVLFDGDILVYRIGFSCLEPSDPVPLHVAFYRLDFLINRVLEEFKTRDYSIYLTDSDINNNFRKKYLPTYKENRKDFAKPPHYYELRDYLQSVHNADLVCGIEADDALGINQTPNTVIASIDKDLLMIPGYHYNIVKKETLVSTDPGEIFLYKNKAGNYRVIGMGFKWFCCQMLVGDHVDNIPGLKKYGPVKSFKALSKLKSKKEMWEKVKELYKKQDKSDEIITNAKCLWILRKPDQEFTEELIEEITNAI